MTKKLLSYQEKFTEKWIENDHGILYGDESYTKFLKTRKYYEENPNGDSFYRGLLCLKTGEMYWLEFGTTGSVDKLIDVTRAKFYDDVDNETFLLNLAIPLIGNRIRYVEANREVLFKLFVILEDFGLLGKPKEIKIPMERKKVVRSDIEAIYNLYRNRILFDEEFVVIEEENDIILAIEFPYEEVRRFVKDSIFAMDTVEYGFTINPEQMFKISQTKR